MKKVAIILLVLITASWVVITNPVWTTPFGDTPTPITSPDNLKDHVTFLATIQPTRNHAQVDSLNRSANYIREQFQSFSVRTSEQIFKVKKHGYKNVMAKFGPNSNEKIVIGAHYDVADDFPGADDNASGIAGLIELGRHLKALNNKLKTSVELVAYTLEEPPFFRTKNMGSAHHAKRLNQQGADVLLMISLEMIGYYSDEWPSQKYPASPLYLFYPLQGNFITIIGNLNDWSVTRKAKRLFKQGVDLRTYSMNAPTAIPGIDFSDHLNYWAHNWPGIMITDTAFYRNYKYHTVEDTPDRLDYNKMAQVVDGVLSIILEW